jgi:hypothetical protein
MNSYVLVNSRNRCIPHSVSPAEGMRGKLGLTVDLLPDRCRPPLQVRIANSAVEIHR